MPTIYALKKQFQTLLRPGVQWLAGCNITANQVTLAALGLSILVGGLIAIWPSQTWPLLCLPLVLLLRMALNAIDGMLAREHNMITPQGAIFNELGDVISDAALYLPFAFIPGISSWVIVLIVVFAIISEMMGVIAVQIGATRRYDGPMGKSDRAFVFGLMALLLGLSFTPGWWLDALLIITLLLLVQTIFNRARSALREIGA